MKLVKPSGDGAVGFNMTAAISMISVRIASMAWFSGSKNTFSLDRKNQFPTFNAELHAIVACPDPEPSGQVSR